MEETRALDNTRFSLKSILGTQAKETFVYAFSTYLPQLGSLLLVPFFWKKLSPADYGIIAIAEIIGSFFAIFMGLSLDFSISRLYYEWPEQERKRRLGAIWVTSWSSSIIIGIISLLIIIPVRPILFPSIDFFPFIFLGIIQTVLKSLTAVVLMTVRIKRLPWLYSIYNVSAFFIQIFLNIIFVLILDKGLYGYFISNLIGGLLIVLGCAIIMSFFAVPCIKNSGVLDSLKFSLPMIPSDIVSGVGALSDRFILQRFAPLDVLGIYYICLKFTGIINSIHSTLKLSYVPFISKLVAEAKKKETATIISRVSMFYELPIFLAGMAIAVFIKDFVILVNRPAYFPVINYLPLLVGPAIIITFNLYFTPGLFLSKRTDLMWIPSLIQTISIIICGFIFIPLFKLNGVIISRYINVISFVIISFILTKRLFPIAISWKKVFLLLFFMSLGIVFSMFINFNSIVVNILLKMSILLSFGLFFLLIALGFPEKFILFKQPLQVEL